MTGGHRRSTPPLFDCNWREDWGWGYGKQTAVSARQPYIQLLRYFLSKCITQFFPRLRRLKIIFMELAYHVVAPVQPCTVTNLFIAATQLYFARHTGIVVETT